ncbi:hypothetical protein CGX12_11835 [Zobellella denitrificans]|uniref:hypothetical protein n=1 Tax=Zobellella denitrificans TaxID=347534 RepID=UPI000B8BEA28|nr:hypothetical protein [Zobellella denitrificans]OXS14904.1 hypothetical protein CGX12_11835 [Zobellella denitrificans]
MTERDLFHGFYRATRLDMNRASFADEERMRLAAEAARAGFSSSQIFKARNAALCSTLNRMQQHHEPSKHSVAIQLAVHTFGRVTKGVA